MADIVVFGTGQWADLADFYFKHDSPHRVVGFTVDREYLGETTHQGRPVVAFEELEQHFPPDTFEIFLPISFKRMNHVRAERFKSAKARGYRCASYVSSHATTFPDFTCGENCFILEDNTIQPFVTIGDNVVMWSGNHIGHHTRIGDHVMITSQVVISGCCLIEPFTFFGVNATVRDETVVANDTLVGMGAVIGKDTEPFQVYRPTNTEPARIRSDRLRSLSHKSTG
jgi:sugar O-acyltransferase (sialic acid O-acetyltransferase NeuD family)